MIGMTNYLKSERAREKPICMCLLLPTMLRPRQDLKDAKGPSAAGFILKAP